MGSALPDPIAGPAGPTGPTGATGSTGPRGASVFGGSSILPNAANYQVGDFFLLSNGYMYKKVADAWQLQCSIKGPQGIKGDTGDVSANPEVVSEVLSTIEIDGIGYQVLDTFSQSLRDYMAVNNNKLELNFAATYNTGGAQSLLQYIKANSTEVTSSVDNGYINVDGTPVQVYDDTNIREVAEGKCKSIVLTDSISISDIKTLISDNSAVFYNIAGTDISTSILNGDYDNVSIGNDIFDSDDSTVEFEEGDYIVFVYDGKFFLDTAVNFENWINVGDICLITELNVPDRWYDSHYYHIMETTKVDLTNYYTKSQADNLLNAKANSSSIATAYDNTLTYSVGAIVMYNGQLYKCSTAVTTAEDFDSDKWDAVNVIGELPETTFRKDTTQYGAFASMISSVSNGETVYFTKATGTSTVTYINGFAARIASAIISKAQTGGGTYIVFDYNDSVAIVGSIHNNGTTLVGSGVASSIPPVHGHNNGNKILVSGSSGKFDSSWKTVVNALIPTGKDTDGNDINTTDTYTLKIVGGNVVAIKDV